MKISDIFRKIADVIDHEEHAGRPDAAIQNPAKLSAASAGLPVDTVDNEDAGADDDVFVPPLQLKLELLKRAVGVDNIYDEGEPRADDVEQPHDHGHEHGHHHMDELARMKQLAAINMIGDDEPLDD